MPPAREPQSLNHWTTRKVPLFIVLISIFVITDELEDLFMFIDHLDFLFAKYLFKSFSHSSILFSLLLTYIKNSLYVPGLNPLLVICNINIFSFYIFSLLF